MPFACGTRASAPSGQPAGRRRSRSRRTRVSRWGVGAFASCLSECLPCPLDMKYLLLCNSLLACHSGVAVSLFLHSCAFVSARAALPVGGPGCARLPLLGRRRCRGGRRAVSRRFPRQPAATGHQDLARTRGRVARERNRQPSGGAASRRFRYADAFWIACLVCLCG